jgi:hypothetical protein
MKTLLIAHRGNLSGPNKNYENKPDYIVEAINKGYDAEIDLRFDEKSEQFYLGHDSNQYKISYEWLLKYSDNIWVHCKDFKALEMLNTIKSPLNYFWHEDDKFTLTSKGFIWTYPKNITGENSVIVSLGADRPRGDYFAICSDYVHNLNLK